MKELLFILPCLCLRGWKVSRHDLQSIRLVHKNPQFRSRMHKGYRRKDLWTSLTWRHTSGNTSESQDRIVALNASGLAIELQDVLTLCIPAVSAPICTSRMRVPALSQIYNPTLTALIYVAIYKTCFGYDIPLIKFPQWALFHNIIIPVCTAMATMNTIVRTLRWKHCLPKIPTTWAIVFFGGWVVALSHKLGDISREPSSFLKYTPETILL